MKPNRHTTRAVALSAFALIASVFPANTANIPAQLPAPDGKPGNPTNT